VQEFSGKPQNEKTEDAPSRPTYEKPAIVWDEVLQVRAGLSIGCNKQSGQSDPCDAAPAS
jgi:hypothetical protein